MLEEYSEPSVERYNVHTRGEIDERARAKLLEEGWIVCVEGGRFGWEGSGEWSAEPPKDQTIICLT